MGGGLQQQNPPQMSEYAESRPFTTDLETPEPREEATSPGHTASQSQGGTWSWLPRPSHLKAGPAPSQLPSPSAIKVDFLPKDGGPPRGKTGETSPWTGKGRTPEEKPGEREAAGLVRAGSWAGTLCWSPAMPHARHLFRGAGPLRCCSQGPFAAGPKGVPPADEQPCAQAASPSWAASHQG